MSNKWPVLFFGVTIIIVVSAVVWAWPPPRPKVGECGVTSVFDPKPDITAYELAVIVKHVSGSLSLPICSSVQNPIPSNLHRHFHAP